MKADASVEVFSLLDLQGAHVGFSSVTRHSVLASNPILPKWSDLANERRRNRMSELTRRTFIAGGLGSVAAPAPIYAASMRAPLRFRIANLGTLPKGDYSSARAINNRGQIVGLSSTGDTIVSGLLRDTRAVLWQNGTVIDLVEK